MRGQALVDGKNFAAALDDFDAALRLTPASAPVDRARLLAGRGLAHEGLAQWPEALADYEAAMALATGEGGQLEDPYVLNSMASAWQGCRAPPLAAAPRRAPPGPPPLEPQGNCHASMGEWAAARSAYQAAADGFQRASGLRRGERLDGAIYAASNAALMLAQLGDEPGAVREMQAVAR